MRRIALIAVLAALVAAGSARAEEDDAARQARWQDLRHALFGDRKVEDGAGSITLEAPERALDAALVPVTIDLPGPAKIKTIYLTIDENLHRWPAPFISARLVGSPGNCVTRVGSTRRADACHAGYPRWPGRNESAGQR